MACTKMRWGVLGCLVGGNELKLYEYDLHTGAVAKIEAAVKQFWIDVRDGTPPKVTGDDLDIVKQLYATVNTESVDLSNDNYLPELCNTALEMAERRKIAEKEEKRCKAEILLKIGNAGYAICNGFRVKRAEIHKIASVVKESTYVKLTIKQS